MRTAQMVWPLPASPAAESVRLEGTRYKDLTVLGKLHLVPDCVPTIRETRHQVSLPRINSFLLNKITDKFGNSRHSSEIFLPLTNLTNQPIVLLILIYIIYILTQVGPLMPLISTLYLECS